MHDEIMMVENFLSKQECDEQVSTIDRLIQTGWTHEQPATTHRKDECLFMSLCALDGHANIGDIGSRILNVALPAYVDNFPILGNTILGVQEIKGQRTPPGGGFHNWHYEHDQGHHGNRVLTWTIYLNDDYDAGETEFIYQQMRVEPKAGMLTIFPCSFLHTHRGNPPHGAYKYILTGWIVDLDPYMARYKFKDA